MEHKFRIGDRVKYVNDKARYPFLNGFCGTIVYILSSSYETEITVKFDDIVVEKIHKYSEPGLGRCEGYSVPEKYYSAKRVFWTVPYRYLQPENELEKFIPLWV